MKNLKIILTLMFVSVVLFTQAQDLIRDTQKGVKANKVALKTTTDNPNAIFKKIEAISKTEKFTPIKLFNINSNKRELTDRFQDKVSGAVFMDLSKNNLAKINEERPKNISFLLPVDNENNIELELTEANFVTEDFVVRLADGEQFDLESVGGIFYQGVVKGDPASIAAVSIFNNSVRAIISDNDGNYVIGAIDAEGNNKKSNSYVSNSSKYVLYNDYNLANKKEFICGNDIEPNYTKSELKNNESIKSNERRNYTQTDNAVVAQVDKYVPIYIECDYSSYSILFNNSIEDTYSFFTSLFNETSIIFASEGVNIKMSEFYIVNTNTKQNGDLAWTLYYGSVTPDWSGYDTDVVNIFTDYLKDDYNGRLAHLAYTIYRNGNIWSGARANRYYVDAPAICQDYLGNNPGLTGLNYGPTAASSFVPYVDAFPNFTRDVYVFAHELGHNFGLRHSYECAWTLSNDPTVIMLNSGNTGLELDDCSESWPPFDANGDGVVAPGEGQPSCTHLNFPPTIMSACQDHPLSNGFGKLPGDVMRYNYNNPCTSAFSDITSPTTTGDFDCRGDVDIFSDFPSLSIYVDPNNCDNEKISVWVKEDDDYWKYIYIKNGTTGYLYTSNGGPTYYLASDNGDYSHINWYVGSGAINIANWSCDCCVVDISNFETDFGIWNDGGAHCWRRGDNFFDGNSNNDYAGTGRVGALIRWNTNSSLMTTDAIDLSGVDEVFLGFSFFGHSMEGNEKFRLQISVDGGATYNNVKQWTFKTTATPDDVNQFNVTDDVDYNSNVHSNVRYAAKVGISTYNLTSNTKFRFRSYTAKWDYVILDNIAITTCLPAGDGSALLRKGEVDTEDMVLETDNLISLNPNPVNNILNIDIEGVDLSSVDEEFDFEIYSLDGRIVKQGTVSYAYLRIDVNELTGNQAYLMKLQTSDGEIFTNKFVKN